jgi:signal transduction histidine kinase
MENPSEKRRLGAVAWIVLGALAAATLCAGTVYSMNFEGRHREEVERELSSIAELKADDLAQWRRERLGDGYISGGNERFAESFGRFLADRLDRDAERSLLTWMRLFRDTYGYDRLFLEGPGGETVLSYPETAERDVAIAAAVPAALRKGTVEMLDFYREGRDGRVHLAVLAPIGASSPIGLLALRIDPESFLYAFIERWPTASRTGETLLVRREGGEAVFLNRLRFQAEPPLSLRLSVEGHPELPAAQAVSGRTGLFRGRDYRGVPVLTALRQVPDSPWALVARIDLSEVEAVTGQMRLILALLALALVGCEATAVIAMARQQRAESYRLKAAAAAELGALNAELEERVALRTAELAASNDELEAFAYSVAHDLRAPLRSIDGFSRVMEEELGPSLGAEGSRVLGIIRESARKMDSLISSLLDISRFGRTRLSTSLIDMRRMAEIAFADCVDPATAAGFEFRVADLPQAEGDATMIERVWGNLISNAVKYSMPGPTHRIEVCGRVEGDRNVYSVGDRGVGFDQRYAGKLFGMFQRLHDDTEFEGNGIGLAIVKRIVQRHGGDAWAEGRVGEGATFFFSLPSRRH